MAAVSTISLFFLFFVFCLCLIAVESETFDIHVRYTIIGSAAFLSVTQLSVCIW